jgi:methylase of polypeptide subunit release factors
MNYYKIKYGKIVVNWMPELDGGGMDFGQDYIHIIKKLFKKVGRVCEFGSGPGFIGFSLLGNGLCDSLCLIDVNPKAIKACKNTIKENKLEGRVSAYTSDSLKNIPKNEKWDLVVSNPPHFKGSKKDWIKNKCKFDPNWKIHKNFYKNISKFLKPNASVLFVECNKGSVVSDWVAMIRNGGLKYIDNFEPSFKVRIMRYAKNWFYLFSVRGGIMNYIFKELIVPVKHLITKNLYYYIWSKKLA